MRFLIADPLSPRSMRYAFDEIAAALAALAASVPNQPPIPLSRPDVGPRLGAVRQLRIAPCMVSAIEAECDRIHRAVHETYIDHADLQRRWRRGDSVDFTVTHVTRFLTGGPFTKA